MNQQKIIDISLPIHPGMITYPGNPVVKIEPMQSMTSFISKITLGSHTGTHIDAPAHAFQGGKGTEQFSLQTLIGPCRVLDMTHCEKSIGVADLENEQIRAGDRILLKTKNSLRGFETFFEDFVYLEPDAANFLTEKQIILFGIDSLSLKKKGDTDNTPHTALLQKDIPILEGLNLADVQAGEYHLICLPLKLVNLDGAPARAILIKEDIRY